MTKNQQFDKNNVRNIGMYFLQNAIQPSPIKEMVESA
jgi:hypothetical protein